MIRLNDVNVLAETAAGPGRTILDRVNLELAERRVAVIGANGSGKSTLLRLLNGLILPSSGRVEVDGLDTRTDARAVRRRVGFVFTDPLAQLVMSTPADDIELSLRRILPKQAQRRAHALALLAERGLERLADQSIYSLSGGERQLVALTSVLAAGPAILVADEPTTLLDLRNRNLVRRAFDGLEQQLVYSTHDLEHAAQAERVLVVDEGRVFVDGEPQASIAAYRALMGAA